MAVQFEELEGSPIFGKQRGNGAGNVTAQRKFKVAWADRYDFMRELWGSYKVVGGQRVFRPPAPFPGTNHVIPTEINIEPFDGNSPIGNEIATLRSPVAKYRDAKVSVKYSTIATPGGAMFHNGAPMNQLVPTGTYLSLSGDISAEMLTVPGRGLFWAPAGVAVGDREQLPDDVSPGMLIPTEEMNFEWLRVPLPPWEAMRDLSGFVNDAEFFGKSAGTVLFVGASYQHDFQFEDVGLWKITYHFRARSWSWNYMYKETAVNGINWMPVRTKEDSSLYLSGDFSKLFRFRAL